MIAQPGAYVYAMQYLFERIPLLRLVNARSIMTTNPGPSSRFHWVQLSVPTILLLLVMALLPIGILAVYAYRIGSESIQEHVVANNQSAATITAELVGRMLDQSVNLAKSFSVLPSLISVTQQHDEEQVRRNLQALVQSNPVVERAFITDKDGFLWSDYPKAAESLGRNFSHRDWYAGVSREWHPYVSEVYQRTAEPRILVVAIAVPMIIKDQVIGIMVCQMRLEGITKWLEHVSIGKQGMVFLVGHGGQIAAHPKLDLQERSYPEYSQIDLVQQALAGKKVTGEYLDPFGRERMIASAVPVTVQGHNWVAVAQQPVASAYEALYKMKLQIGMAGMILAFVAAAVAVNLWWRDKRTRELNNRLAQSNKELRDLTVKLENANHELESFSYSVSHDLRAPLRAVDGFSSILQEDFAGQLNDKGRDYIQRIRAANDRMRQLIDDLLQLSRIIRTSQKIEGINLSAMAARIIEAFINMESKRQVTFKIAENMVVFADSHLLHIAMENLIGNAWKYTSKEPHAVIEVGMSYDRNLNSSIYYVKDNGVGFDPRNKNRLFTPFQRLHSEHEFEGTGIGLATVQRVIHRHNGKIWAESSPANGATFFFTLPSPMAT